MDESGGHGCGVSSPAPLAGTQRHRERPRAPVGRGARRAGGSGEEPALSSVRALRPHRHGLAFRMLRDHALAEDAVQDAFPAVSRTAVALHPRVREGEHLIRRWCTTAPSTSSAARSAAAPSRSRRRRQASRRGLEQMVVAVARAAARAGGAARAPRPAARGDRARVLRRLHAGGVADRLANLSTIKSRMFAGLHGSGSYSRSPQGERWSRTEPRADSGLRPSRARPRGGRRVRGASAAAALPRGSRRPAGGGQRPRLRDAGAGATARPARPDHRARRAERPQSNVVTLPRRRLTPSSACRRGAAAVAWGSASGPPPAEHARRGARGPRGAGGSGRAADPAPGRC